MYIKKYNKCTLNPPPLTGVDLSEWSTGPDVVQTSGPLRCSGADVGEDRRCEESRQFLFPQNLHLRAVRSHTEVTQNQQLSLTYNKTNTSLAYLWPSTTISVNNMQLIWP